MKIRPKNLTKSQITKIIMEYEERFAVLAESFDEIMHRQPEYEGGLQLNIIDASDKVTNFYMVTDFVIKDNYVTFYHLLTPDTEGVFTIASFPSKEGNKSSHSYIKSLERSKRWNKVYEQLLVPNVARMQFTGHFTYSRAVQLTDNNAKFTVPKGDVLRYSSRKKTPRLEVLDNQEPE